MGPESKNAPPSAKNLQNKFWRPFAAFIVVGSSLVYSGDRSSINLQIFPPRELFLSSLPVANLPAEPDTGSLISINRSDCDQSERDWYLKNCKELFLKANPDNSVVKEWLEQAGWPPYLWQEASAVIFCESRNNPGSYNEVGPYYGLFQLDALWFSYAGQDLNLWSEPVVNSRVALATYNYDIERGQAPWTQWGCRP